MATKVGTLFSLFLTFLKISPITFGGGYAMISLIESEVVNKKQWINKGDIYDVFIIAQTVPGAVAINSAILIGYRVCGTAGALISLLGIMLPTIFIVGIVSLIYFFFNDNPYLQSAFNGIGAAVVAFILHAGIVMGRTTILNKTTFFIMILSIFLLIFFSINPIFLIMGGSVIGMIGFKRKSLRKEENNDALSNDEKIYYKDGT